MGVSLFSAWIRPFSFHLLAFAVFCTPLLAITREEAQKLELQTKIAALLAEMQETSEAQASPPLDTDAMLKGLSNEAVTEGPKNLYARLASNALQFAKQERVNFLSNTMEYGGSAFGAWSLSKASKAYGAYLIYNAGYGVVASTAWATIPFWVAYFPAFELAREHLKERAWKSLLGSKEKYDLLKENRRGDRERAGLSHEKDSLLQLNSGEKFYSVVFSNPGLLKTLWKRWYSKEPFASFQALSNYFSNEGIEGTWSAKLENQQISDRAKQILLLHAMAKEHPEALEKLKALYPKSFSEAAPLAEHPFLHWASKFTSATTKKDLETLLETVPEGTSKRLLARAWESTLLPLAANNSKEISFAESLRLKSEAKKLLAMIELEENGLSDGQLKQQIGKTLYKNNTVSCMSALEKARGITQ